jgi:UDP-hydrolysing UDP-N-acetyl-D-glucosamine 2-epimerase
MGEDPERVFNLGCPSIDLVARAELGDARTVVEELNRRGTGSTIDPERPFALMLQHPVTTEYGSGLEQVDRTLDAIAATGMQALVFWPNVDAGSNEVAKGIRVFRERGRDAGFHFVRNVPAETFIRLMAHCSVMVGNSSAALREGAFLGTPAVNIGTRQHGREHAVNVVDVEHETEAIADAMRDQIRAGRYERDELFGDGSAGRRIAAVLAQAQASPQKRLAYDAQELLSAG